LLFRPLVAWADRFRFEQDVGAVAPRSWVLTMLRRSQLVRLISGPFHDAMRWSYRTSFTRANFLAPSANPHGSARWIDRAWFATVTFAALFATWKIAVFVLSEVTVGVVGKTVLLGLLTLLRVLVLIAIASAIWVPVGVWIGIRPGVARIAQPVAQFFAAFPANILFPIAVSAIVAFHLNPNIWLSPLMVLGTQWYILFNVIAGAAALPSELRDIGTNLRVRGWLWWRRVALPAIFPFYVTGAITASGGSWNASIVAEIATWGNERVEAAGLGAYIARATEAANYHRIVLGIAVMSAFVIIINRTFWRPLYRYAERRFRLG